MPADGAQDTLTVHFGSGQGADVGLAHRIVPAHATALCARASGEQRTSTSASDSEAPFVPVS